MFSKYAGILLLTQYLLLYQNDYHYDEIGEQKYLKIKNVYP